MHRKKKKETSKVMKQYFACKNIRVLEWPVKSLDLNIVENYIRGIWQGLYIRMEGNSQILMKKIYCGRTEPKNY